jgi:CBS domain-containing protein
MTTDYVVVPSYINLEELARNYVLLTGRQYFMVSSERKLEGVISIKDIEKIPREKWSYIIVKEIMTPAELVAHVQPEDEAISVAELMEEKNIVQVPVLKDGFIVGIITKENLVYSARLRSALRTRH